MEILTDQSTFLLFTLGGFVLNLIIFFYLIRSATKSENMYKEQLRQSMYLATLLKKNGVTEEELERIDTAVGAAT